MNYAYCRTAYSQNKMPRIDQCVCPLWVPECGKPELIGTGTLLIVEQTRFLITAAHVTDIAVNGTLLVGNQKGFQKIRGYGKATQHVSGSRQDDRNDTAVIKLTEDTVAFIEELFVPLPVNYTDVNGSFHSGVPYEFSGYPWRKVQLEKTEAILEPRLYTFRVESIPETNYGVLGIAPHTHIAVKFDPKQVTDANGRTVAAPNPEGMSGGPVWRFTPTDLGGRLIWTPSLAGIVIEYISSKQTLIGVRINAALEGIRRLSPNLSASIPVNPSLEIICRDYHE